MGKKRIIWIDDDIETCLLRPYLDELEDNNYEVVKIKEISNVMHVLKKEAEESLAAIIVDVIMPPQDLDFSETRGGIRTGLVIMKNILEEKDLKDIPLIVFSNMDDDNVSNFCRNNGILYLAKRDYFSSLFVNKLNEIIQNNKRITRNGE